MSESEWVKEFFGGQCPSYVADIFKAQNINDKQTLCSLTNDDIEELCKMFLIGDRVNLRKVLVMNKKTEDASQKDTSQDNEKIAIIKDRLRMINEQRSLQSKMNKNKKKKKQTYVIHVGVKRKVKDRWQRHVQFPVVKMLVKKDMGYDELLLTMKEDLGVKTKDCVLLDGKQEEVNRDGFSIVHYIQQHKRYIGATRLYVGLSKPTSTLMQGEVRYGEVIEYLRQAKEESLFPQQEGAEMCDLDKYVPYYNDVKPRLFMAYKKMSFELKHTPWGKFLLIPIDVVDELNAFKYDGMEYCYLLETPLKYFMQLQHLSSAELKQDDIVKLDPNVNQAYIDWLSSVSSEIQ